MQLRALAFPWMAARANRVHPRDRLIKLAGDIYNNINRRVNPQSVSGMSACRRNVSRCDAIPCTRTGQILDYAYIKCNVRLQFWYFVQIGITDKLNWICFKAAGSGVPFPKTITWKTSRRCSFSKKNTNTSRFMPHK